MTDTYNQGKRLAFITFNEPTEANAAMETDPDNKNVKEKIPKDDHRAAAGNATADDAMTRPVVRASRAPLARRKVAPSATWSQRTE